MLGAKHNLVSYFLFEEWSALCNGTHLSSVEPTFMRGLRNGNAPGGNGKGLSNAAKARTRLAQASGIAWYQACLLLSDIFGRDPKLGRQLKSSKERVGK